MAFRLDRTCLPIQAIPELYGTRLRRRRRKKTSWKAGRYVCMNSCMHAYSMTKLWRVCSHRRRFGVSETLARAVWVRASSSRVVYIMAPFALISKPPEQRSDTRLNRGGTKGVGGPSFVSWLASLVAMEMERFLGYLRLSVAGPELCTLSLGEWRKREEGTLGTGLLCMLKCR